MNLLGLSSYYHDSAAALLKDQEIAAAVQEERFTRRKADESFPKESISFCLSKADIKLSDLDAVVFYDKPWITFERLLETYAQFAPVGIKSFLMSMPSWLNQKLNLRVQLKKELIRNFSIEKKNLPPILFSGHHLSHAASAFYPSSFENAAVLCLDGVGEWSTVSAWHGQGRQLKPLWEIKFPHSIGLLYSAFTYYCGFKVNSGEYKLMGLAPFGKPTFQKVIEENLICIADDGTFRMNMQYFDYCTGFKMVNSKFEKLFGFPARQSDDPTMNSLYMDLAASIQSVTEKIMLRLALTLKKETGADNLCLAGGVALNCVGNGRISEEKIFKNIFVQPAAGDAGGALGAAYAAYHLHFNKDRELTALDRMKGSLLGPSYSEVDIEMVLKNSGLSFEKLETTTLLKKTARLLEQQKIIGWFQGAMEFGPRALGSRSILGDPRNKDMKTIMNLKIKFRESFRPFAPSILSDQAATVFSLHEDSPYMLLVANSKFPDQYPSITHVDNSARVQTVDPVRYPLYYNLISEFNNLTGCPMVINTSFNIRGEPIVCDPKEAIDCFINTDIDVLAIGDFLVEKSANPQIKKNEKWSALFAKD